MYLFMLRTVYSGGPSGWGEGSSPVPWSAFVLASQWRPQFWAERACAICIRHIIIMAYSQPTESFQIATSFSLSWNSTYEDWWQLLGIVLMSRLRSNRWQSDVSFALGLCWLWSVSIPVAFLWQGELQLDSSLCSEKAGRYMETLVFEMERVTPPIQTNTGGRQKGMSKEANWNRELLSKVPELWQFGKKFWLRQGLVPVYPQAVSTPKYWDHWSCHYTHLKKLFLHGMTNPQTMLTINEFCHHVTKFRVRGG